MRACPTSELTGRRDFILADSYQLTAILPPLRSNELFDGVTSALFRGWVHVVISRGMSTDASLRLLVSFRPKLQLILPRVGFKEEAARSFGV
jgi:hypothetical protein